MAAMDFGVGVHPTPRGGTIPAMLGMNERLLTAAVEHDLSCWVIDHFQFDAQPILECYAFLAYHAGKFPSLRWGNLVLGQGYRNPALTAKIAASLQFLTGGRYILGIGAGWKEDDYRAYGYPFPSARESANSKTPCASASCSGRVAQPHTTARITRSRMPIASRRPNHRLPS